MKDERNDKMRAVVVDDEVLAVEHLCRMLSDAGLEVSGSSDSYLAYDLIMELHPDAIFLDIDMPVINGLELAEKVNSNGYSGEIVFITAYRQYAIEAFGVNALDYLLKPVMGAALEKSLEKIRKRRAVRQVPVIEEKKRINISLFETFSISNSDAAPIRFSTIKCVELFAYMLLQGEKEISKWKMIDAVWPDKDEAKGYINLRSTVSRINKTMKENQINILLVSSQSGYRLEIKEQCVDVDAFQLRDMVLKQDLINENNVRRYEDIIFGYRDVVLTNIGSEWCNEVRETYHRYFLKGANKVLQYYDKSGAEPLNILNMVELILQYEPYDEAIREYTVRLHHRMGGRKAAERYYNIYRSIMITEVGMKPSKTLDEILNC